VPPDQHPDDDTEWAQVARIIPGGFAGVYFEPLSDTAARGAEGAARQRLVIRLVDTTQRKQAIAALEPFLRYRYRYLRSYLAEAIAVPARWTYVQLYEWYRYLNRQVWPLGGVTMSDLDEGNNRIMYGVESPVARDRLLKRLRELGVPCGLVDVEFSRVVPNSG
jgi:hypothetical protein